jgi:hypothetical protein
VSYDIAVWEGDRPANDAAALETYNELWARYEDTDEPASDRILSYIEELTAKYPDLDDLPDDDVDDSPWADSPLQRNVMGPFFYFALVPSKAGETVPFIVETARRHELVCFDPQQVKLLSPEAQ